MIATIPSLRRFDRYEDIPFAPPVAYRAIVSTGGDQRLAAFVNRLFGEWGIEVVECAPGKGRGDFTLYWGPPEEQDSDDRYLYEAELPPEGYAMRLTNESATVAALDAAGMFYGMQTLRQLLDTEHATAADIVDWPDLSFRCMNYDLRQTFSKPEKLIEYVDMLSAFKTNYLLIEYEDKFPFERYRKLVHPRHALTDRDLDDLLDAARRNFIEIIPLQQSFGHLEYVLGREEYRSLRETDESTGELCPCRDGSFELVCGLLEELASRHPGSRYLHLGCDEVYSLCECPACRERFGGSRVLAFLSFVNRLIAFVCGLGKLPIIWQDVLAECSDEELSRLDPRVTVMIWNYNGKNVARMAKDLTIRLRRNGVKVLGAPAVRCFDRKDDQNYPLVQERLSNIGQWAEAAEELKLDGLVGTNWTAVFSLGVPYGVFETTWYTMAYFADKTWRRTPEGSGRFIDRFLRVFHGIPASVAQDRLGCFEDDDYYAIVPELVDAVNRNVDVAELITAMVAFEIASDRSRTIHKYAYRAELFPASEPERRSLANNYRITRDGLARSRERMKNALAAFQPPDMVEHYLMSRFYLHDYLEEYLYRKMDMRL